MSYCIVDANGWQNVLDLKTGKKINADTKTSRMVKKALAAHRYPGDMHERSNAWVTDVALDLLYDYQPEFIFLSYSQQYFSARFEGLLPLDREKMIYQAFLEAERFIRESGFRAIVIGSGDMATLAGDIDLSKLDGLAVASHWATHYAGLFSGSQADLAYIKEHPNIESCITAAEFVKDMGGGEARFMPEYILTAKEGFCFRTPALRHPVLIPAANSFIPASTDLGEAKCITDIRRLVLEGLNCGPTAVILLEGVGIKDFLLPYTTCQNGFSWYYYEPGELQYLAISQGRQQMLRQPPGHSYFLSEQDEGIYPFSGYFREMPEETIGQAVSGRSLAVGNRSMFMHTVTGTDIAVECFARNLNNQGCMAVIHREDK